MHTKKYKAPQTLSTSVARCPDVSTAQSGQESSGTDMSKIRSAAFDFQQTGYTLQTFMFVATILCLKEWRGSYVHFYVEKVFDLQKSGSRSNLIPPKYSQPVVT